MATARANLDVTQYVLISNGGNPLTLQAHNDAVRIVFSDAQPAVGTASFHILHGGEAPWHQKFVDTKVYALATSGMSSLTITDITGATTPPSSTELIQLLRVAETSPGSNRFYRGEAVPGTATSETAWRIHILDLTGAEEVRVYADGSQAIDKVWDDRAGYTY